MHTTNSRAQITRKKTQFPTCRLLTVCMHYQRSRASDGRRGCEKRFRTWSQLHVHRKGASYYRHYILLLHDNHKT